MFVQDHLMAEKFQKLERLQTGRGVGQAVSDHHLGDRRMDRAGDRHDRRSPLTPEQEQQGRERIDGGPLPDDKVCSLRGADIKIILENEFDVCRSLSATDDLLHRLGYSCLQPRPEHDKCDEMICDGRGFHTGKRVIVPENVALTRIFHPLVWGFGIFGDGAGWGRGWRVGAQGPLTPRGKRDSR